MKNFNFPLVLSLAVLVFLSGCISSPPGEEEKNPRELAKNYFLFSQAAYEKALSENRTILLYFYDKFNGVDTSERPELVDAFNEMDYDNFIGFEVDFQEEESLKEQFQVTGSHTKIILQGGEVVLNTREAFSDEELKEEIENIIG